MTNNKLWIHSQLHLLETTCGWNRMKDWNDVSVAGGQIDVVEIWQWVKLDIGEWLVDYPVQDFLDLRVFQRSITDYLWQN